MLVIFIEYATSEPAPDPLPGPTGISFSFDHLIKSETIKEVSRKAHGQMVSIST